MKARITENIVEAVIGLGIMLSFTPLVVLAQIQLIAPPSAAHVYPSMAMQVYLANLLGFTLGSALFALPLRRQVEELTLSNQPFLLAVNASTVLLFLVHEMLPYDASLLWLHLALGLAAGVSSSLAIVVWGSWQSLTLSPSENRLVLSGALLIAAITQISNFVVAAVSTMASGIFCLVLAVVAFVCLRHLSQGNVILHEKRDYAFDDSFKLPRITRALLFVTGFVISLLLGILEYNSMPYAGPAMLSLALIAVALLLVTIRHANFPRLSLGLYIRIVYIGLAVGLIGVLLFRASAPTFASFLVAAAWYLQVTLYFGTAFDTSGRVRIAFIRVWQAFGTLSGLGTLCGIAALFLIELAGLDPTDICLAILFLVSVVLLAMAPDARNNTPEFSRGSFIEDEDPERRANRLEKTLSDSYGLTPREREVLHGLSLGLSYRLIAQDIGISEDTVRTHIRNLYRKCGVHSRAELLALLNEHPTLKNV